MFLNGSGHTFSRPIHSSAFFIANFDIVSSLYPLVNRFKITLNFIPTNKDELNKLFVQI